MKSYDPLRSQEPSQLTVPVTTILSASERNFSDTTLTAAGDAIDQNTECVHATPIRDTINIPYEAEKADSIWKIPKSAIVPNKKSFKIILFNKSNQRQRQ